VTGQYLQFLLVPDSSAARRVRRAVVETGARRGVVVGTWPELVEYARRAYLLPESDGDWEETFHSALAEMVEGFWAESFLVSPQDTGVAIEAAFTQAISASDPLGTFSMADGGDLPERPRQHLEDLVRLAQRLEGRLPPVLSTVRDLMAADPADAIRHIFVYQVEDVPALTRWQASLIEKINRDADVSPDLDLAAKLTESLSGAVGAKVANGLATLQARLFSPVGDKAVLDESIQWVGVRDFLEEAEVAAGMVQTMLEKRADLQPADIGLLLPESFEYAVAVDDAFTLAGLALSGLPVERWQRDLGREALFHFLYCRQKPAPAMALAVCLSSPLMPWSREDGAVLAQTVMGGDYRLRPLGSFGRDARAMLDLIREGDETPNALLEAVRAFVSLLDGGDEFVAHVQQARVTADSICVALEGAADIDWVDLRRSVSPRYITTGESPDFNLEGITVWREGHEPWRPVRHLIVFGFAEGNYPTVPGSSPVFVADDLKAIRDSLGLPVQTPDDELMHRRARFKRQLGAVSDSVSFLVPRRDPSGAAQAPSESIVFMQQLFDAPGDIVLELDAAADRGHVRYLAQAGSDKPEPPPTIKATDIQFGRDLLALRAEPEGQLKPESPSSLETLMVSRLAWLLRRLDAEPLGWAPERPNAMLFGTLAHHVFEKLFQKDVPIPGREDIPVRVEPLLDDAIRRYGPFLRTSQWQVERHHLAAGIVEAALAWRDVLDVLGAQVLAGEEWLEGRLNGIPIHGQADGLLGLPENRLLVVDYKRASASSRRPRMQKGYDSQASLYRTMLHTGGPKKAKENAELINRLRTASQTGIVYYMLNDQTALSDSVFVESGGIPHWEALEGDVAGRAIGLIERRLNEVRDGVLCLNREGDALFFEKYAGIKPYALENSPLIPLFTVPGEAEEGG